MMERKLSAVSLPMLQWRDEVLAFAQWLPPLTTVLEIGTGPGGLTMFLGMLASGRVVSVDKPAGSSTGLSVDECRRRNSVLLRENERFVGVLGDSHSPTTYDAVAVALGDELVDLLFIDGDHTYEGVWTDFTMYSPLVRRGGLIAFHDINADAFESHGVDVPRFWRALSGEKHEFTVKGEWGGIGVWVKP